MRCPQGGKTIQREDTQNWIESLVPEYIEYWLCYIIVVIIERPIVN